MKTNSRKIVAFLVLSLLIIIHATPVFAFPFIEKKPQIEVGEYSEEYKEWLKLPEEEKEKVIRPNIVNIEPVKVFDSNPLKRLGADISSTQSKFSLADIIPNNVVVRNQGKTELCWAFATLASLETTLGLKDYYNGNANNSIYDFSEKHMAYGSSNYFNDGVQNKYGLNQTPNSQSSLATAHAYLVSGIGAVPEIKMPYSLEFPKINYDDFTSIKPTSEVRDFEIFGGTSDRQAIISKIKECVVKYGGVTTAIHGAQPYSKCFNAQTGAIYCNNKNEFPLDHAVSIIGWDDNYSIDNFTADLRPSSNGAFIIKNSWGDKYFVDFNSEEYRDFKKAAFEPYKDDYIARGINSADEIPNEVINEALRQMGFEIESNGVSLRMGDNGIMYVSYEDVNILDVLISIQNANNSPYYDNIYQYSYTEYNAYITTKADKFYLGIINDKNTNNPTDEYITQVGLWVITPVKAKVLVNPNGDKSADAKEVALQAGEYETLTPGYHTLELNTPVKIEGSKFSVFVECEPTEKDSNGKASFPLVAKQDDVRYSLINPQPNQTIYLEKLGDDYVDLGTASSIQGFDNYISTLKVFTRYHESEGNGGNNGGNNGSDNGGNNGSNNGGNNQNADFSHTDFSNATAKCNELKDYTFSDSSKQEYITMDITISNIRIDMNRNYNYKVYLSSKQSENGISGWIDMDNVRKTSDSLSFTIDSRKINNLSEILNGQRLYIYVQETETINGSKDIKSSNSILLSGYGKAITYKDGVVISTSNEQSYSENNRGSTTNYSSPTSNGNNNSNNNNNGANDNTTAKTVLPNTGFREIVYILVCVLTATGIVMYVLYRRIDY